MRSLLFLLFFAEAGLQLRGENEHKDTLAEDKDTLNFLATSPALLSRSPLLGDLVLAFERQTASAL